MQQQADLGRNDAALLPVQRHRLEGVVMNDSIHGSHYLEDVVDHPFLELIGRFAALLHKGVVPCNISNNNTWIVHLHLQKQYHNELCFHQSSPMYVDAIGFEKILAHTSCAPLPSSVVASC